MERTIAIASNLIPLGGILLLGWSAAPALLLIWIDLVFACVRFGREAYAAFRPVFVDPNDPNAGAMAAAIAVFIWAFALPPAGLAAAGIVWIIEPQYPGGLMGALGAERGVVLGIAVQIAIRAYQFARQPLRRLGESRVQALKTGCGDAPPNRLSASRRDERIKALRPAFEEAYLNLLYRAVLMGVLAVAFYAFGRSGFLGFVVLASLFTIYVELHENWLGTLLRRIQARRLPR